MPYNDIGVAKYTIDNNGHITNGVASAIMNDFANDAAPSSSGAFLVSELEKRDTLVRQPLTTYTWEKNVPVKVGGGWVEYASNLNIDFGISGGTGNGVVNANGSNAVPVIQGNFGKDLYKAHIVAMFLRINEFDAERAQITGRSLDSLLTQGVRLGYEKHMDESTFKGLSGYGTTGLLNNPNVTAQSVAAGASTKTTWADKTPNEILADVNGAITTVWGRAGNDMSAIPNHITLPFEQYNYIATTKVSDIAEKTILTFILENNICNINGGNLVFGMTNFAKGAGASSTNRMVVYVMDPRFVAVEELQPLTRRRTIYNPNALSMDTLYAANVSETEIFYTQTVGYFDGI